MQKKIKQFSLMFLCGFFDSISIYWIKKILFAVHPVTRQTHPKSMVLLKTFKDAFIQVIVLFIGIPALLDYLEWDITASILSVVFMLLSYGYLFFYNIQVMTATKQISLWSSKFPNSHFCEFDVKQNFNILYSMSNLIKNFIFLLLYYTPMNLLLLFISMFFPFVGSVLLVISQSFFNATFYYLQKWPYDRFNIAFIERNAAYMLGFGFFVSFICNVVLSGNLALAIFFLISLWMMINCQLYSPPSRDYFQSFSQLWQCVQSPAKRAGLPNAFNQHRQKLRKDKTYKTGLRKGTTIVKPALTLTQILNKKLGRRLERKNLTKIQNQQQNKDNQNEQLLDDQN